jgi:hypothetical protein
MLQICRIICKKYAEYAGSAEHNNNNATYAENMQKICRTYAENMLKICTKYAEYAVYAK